MDPKKLKRLKSRHGVVVCWVCVWKSETNGKAPSQNGPKIHRKTLSVAKEDCGHRYTGSRQGRFLGTAHPLQAASRCLVPLSASFPDEIFRAADVVASFRCDFCKAQVG